MDKFKESLGILNKTFGVWEFRGIYVEGRYWMAVAVVFLVFLLLLVLARVRREYIHWSISKPSLAMIFWGFILALIFEGILLVFGKTLFTEILGWKNAPKPISTIIDIGRNKMISVMGAKVEYSTPSYKSVVESYGMLNNSDREKVEEYICR